MRQYLFGSTPSTPEDMASERQADLAVKFYEHRAGTYDFTWHASFAERFNGFLSIESGQHVLDLACGTGLLTFLEADRTGPNGRVVGVDVTPGMLFQAKAKKEKGGDKYAHVELYKGDILDLEAIDALKGQTFDLITIASALVLLPDPKAAVGYWTKFLKPGGSIVMDSTHPRNLVSGMVLERTARRLNLPIPYNREWSDSEDALEELLESAGLDVAQVVTVDNQAGYGRREYDLEHWEDHFVEKIIMGDTARTFTDREVRTKAHGVFREEFEKLAVNGKVEEVDAVFLGIARKRESLHHTNTRVLCLRRNSSRRRNTAELEPESHLLGRLPLRSHQIQEHSPSNKTRILPLPRLPTTIWLSLSSLCTHTSRCDQVHNIFNITYLETL
jgi:ubiquinone/menaquinone biosynthesis C-methylase UbiE